MSIADAIAKATAGVVPKLIGPTGFARSTVTTTRRDAVTRDQAGRRNAAPTYPIVDGKWMVKEIALARAQRVWGMQSTATAEATLPLGADVQFDDVVNVTEGDYAGTVYEVVQTRRDPLGNRLLVALGPTGQTP
jgi:flavoprotein